MKTKLTEPDCMNITCPDDKVYIGGSQSWYEDRWHKVSGCGPVSASNIIWYMTRLCGSKARYIELMSEMYTFVTPGIQGVNNSSIFTDGISRYLAKAGICFNPLVLEIPGKSGERPYIDVVLEFIESALRSDAPVAFLNLSNGSLGNLESWHWVTIIAIETDTMHVEFCDYGNVHEIDIYEWLRTSRLGGAFIYLSE